MNIKKHGRQAILIGSMIGTLGFSLYSLSYMHHKTSELLKRIESTQNQLETTIERLALSEVNGFLNTDYKSMYELNDVVRIRKDMQSIDENVLYKDVRDQIKKKARNIQIPLVSEEESKNFNGFNAVVKLTYRKVTGLNEISDTEYKVWNAVIRDLAKESGITDEDLHEKSISESKYIVLN